MKNLTLLGMLLLSFPLFCESTIPISVTRFQGDAALSGDDEVGCYYWSYFGPDRLGAAFQERLIADLVKDKRFTVLERQTLPAIYSNEFKLPNAEKTKPIPKGHFERARFTLVGVVKSFAWCTAGEGAGVNVGAIFGFGDMNIGGRRNKAEVSVEVRVIDVKSGKVIDSVTGTGERTNFTVAADGIVKKVSFNSKKFKNTPIGEAIDEAIGEASRKIKKLL